MIFREVSNYHRPSSIKDLAKNFKPPLEASPDPHHLSLYCGLFPDIYTYSHGMAETWTHFYTGPTDPLFLARNKQIQWMFDSRGSLELHQDTVFHAAAYLDKYIALTNPPASQIPLIAATCLVISSKANQIYPVCFYNLIKTFKMPFKAAIFPQIQSDILQAFEFELPTVTLMELFKLDLTHYNLPDNLMKPQSILSILQGILLDFEMMTYSPKFGSLAAVAVTCKMKRQAVSFQPCILSCPQYKCSIERLGEVISCLRARFSKEQKINNPQNSNKAIQF